MGRDGETRKGLGSVRDGGSVAVVLAAPCAAAVTAVQERPCAPGSSLLSRMVSIRVFLSLFLI